MGGLDCGGNDSSSFLMNKKVGIRAESRRKWGRVWTVMKVQNSHGDEREKQLTGCKENGSGKAQPRSRGLCKLLVSSHGARQPGTTCLVLSQASHTESAMLDRKRVNIVGSPLTSVTKQAKLQLVAIIVQSLRRV